MIKKYYGYIAVSILAVAIYSNTLHHHYAFDDVMVIEQNSYVRDGIKGVQKIITNSFYAGYGNVNLKFYRPLPLIMFALETELFGNNPMYNHLINILLYAITSLLLLLVSQKICRNYHLSIPLLITLLFVVHPVHTEVIANIKSRDLILCFLFALISVYFLIKFTEKKQNIYLVLSLLSYLFSLFSKEDSVTFIVILPLLLYYVKAIQTRKLYKLTGLYLGIVLIYLTIRIIITSDFIFFSGKEISITNNSITASDTVFEWYATSVEILGRYLRLLFYPYPLCSDYSYNQITVTDWSDFDVLFSFFIYASILYYAIQSLKTKDLLGFGMCFFLVALSITSNLFVKLEATMGERFLYIPSYGFSIAFILFLHRLFKNRRIFFLCIGFILILFSIRTIDRNKDWKNNLTLFKKDVKTCPRSFRIHKVLAIEYAELGIAETEKHKKQELLNESLKYARYGLEIHPENNKLHNIAGFVNLHQENYSQAKKYFKKSIQLDPKYPNALINMAKLFIKLDDYEKAKLYCNWAKKYDNQNIHVKIVLSEIYNHEKNYERSYQLLREVLAIHPLNQDALYNMSLSLIGMKNYCHAKSYLLKLLKYYPTNTPAYQLLESLSQVDEND